ncbi:hypothetical protein KDA_48370 [Dictyobacter alpinus]|uniref:Uncharacterized protein n=1 Tax=Dictyobacter alpinus TaxID=2014873 RepID=A0A402BD79_9CHLR|nr:hypothetical protein KDA_48370 [Dictyobacter alpinus]
MAFWEKTRHGDEQVAHLISARIVHFARQHQASALVFEHLGNLKSQSGALNYSSSIPPVQ